MTKKVGQKISASSQVSVEVSVDEFTAVFRYPNQSDSGAEFSLEEYAQEAHDFCHQLGNQLGLEVLGGLINASPASRYDTGLATDDGDQSVRLSYASRRPDMGVLVKFGGRGLKSYNKTLGTSTPELMGSLLEFSEEMAWPLRFSRLDIAVDVFNDGVHTITGIHGKLDKGLWEFRRRPSVNSREKETAGRLSVQSQTIETFGRDGQLETLYLGARGKTRLRIYDKKAEQLGHSNPVMLNKAKECDSWTRYEAEFHNGSHYNEADEYARQIIERCASGRGGSEFESDVLRGIFCDRFNLYNVRAGKMLGWWDKLIFKGIVIPLSLNKKDVDSWQDLEQAKAYFLMNSGMTGLLDKVAFEAEANGEDPEEAKRDLLNGFLDYMASEEYRESNSTARYKNRMRAVIKAHGVQ